MEVKPPPPMLVDPAIDPREGAIGVSLQSFEQLTTPESGSAVPVPGEQVDIHALDVVGALLILIAEVREALTLVVSSPPPPTVPQPLVPGDGPAVQVGPATAPLTVIQMMLQRLPAQESQPPAVWLNTAAQVEGAVRTALDRAVDAVTAWRDVPRSAVAVVGDARTVVLAALDEDSQNPLWLMPQMMDILPRMQRYWTLRRRLRRSLDHEAATRSDEREDPEQTFSSTDWK